MGLCKCPQKKVTNQFCFKHRVNVCEHCMVSSHPNCTVKSYLQWLNDSGNDSNPNCSLCNESLEDNQCSRLVCYDVFHSACLDEWGRGQSPNLAPAGFRCPVCRAPVFPDPNLASPIALALRATLEKLPWARRNMGLPAKESLHNGISRDEMKDLTKTAIPNTPQTETMEEGRGVTAHQSMMPPTHRKASHSDEGIHSVSMMQDTDDNKYQRRPANVWFKRWWRSYQPCGVARGSNSRRLYAVVMVMGLFTLAFLIISHWDKREQNMDPMFDPLNNPNIHVQEDSFMGH